jgi:hypothetical protein
MLKMARKKTIVERDVERNTRIMSIYFTESSIGVVIVVFDPKLSFSIRSLPLLMT